MNKVKTVLIIEDSAIDIFINTKVINQSGLSEEVISLPSARDALMYLEISASRNILPNIIFLDIRMPDMDGFEFMVEFAKLSEEIKTKCKVVMLSSTIDPIELDKARSNELIFAFIPKPLTRLKVEELFA